MNTSFCIHTRGGNAFDPQTGQIDFIDITDIAHALSQLCRYARHCDKFYSVAESMKLPLLLVLATIPSTKMFLPIPLLEPLLPQIQMRAIALLIP